MQTQLQEGSSRVQRPEEDRLEDVSPAGWGPERLWPLCSVGADTSGGVFLPGVPWGIFPFHMMALVLNGSRLLMGRPSLADHSIGSEWALGPKPGVSESSGIL